MAVGYYELTAAADPQTVCTDFEAEANISAAQAIGDVDEAGAVIITGEKLASPNKVIFKITGTAALDITNAATAVGGVQIAAGYPDPA